MTSYPAATVQVEQERGGSRTVSQEDNEVSVMLANALRKMDGLIGDCRYVARASTVEPSW